MVLRKSIVCLFSIISLSFFASDVYSQKFHLELKSITSNRVRKVYENDIVTIHTAYKRYKGRLKFITKDFISINGHRIRIENIIKIEIEKVKVKTTKT